jgi:AAA15 family ATPase/GTPase
MLDGIAISGFRSFGDEQVKMFSSDETIVANPIFSGLSVA